MVKTKSRLLSLLLVFFVTFAAVWSINFESTYAATKKIHLKKKTVTLTAGKTYQQKLLNKNGKVISATKVKWKSLKTSVAKISKKGKITALKAGTAKMTAKYKGKTYKFTVKVKAPPHNTYIGVDQTSVDLRVGQRATLIVYTDKGKDIVYGCNNSNVDCEWGDWLSNDIDSYFYITGVRVGTSTVKVYDDYDHKVSATIQVNVTDEPRTLTDFYNYIQETGIEDSNGNKVLITDGVAESDFAAFTAKDDTIQFAYNEPDTLFVLMTVALPQPTTTQPIVMIEVRQGTMLGAATMNVSTFSEDTTLSFTKIGGDLAVNQALCNKGLQLAMSVWNAVLFDNGFRLDEFGFKNM